MITVTLTFKSTDEALAALKKLEGTAAEPANTAGKSAKTEKPAAIPSTAAQDVALEQKPSKPLDFKTDIAPAFLNLATVANGAEKQKQVVDHFGVARLSQVPAEKYADVLAYIKELAS